MAENSKIEWTDHTFNPWIGCQKVSPGCDHCYAEAMMDHRYATCSGDRTASASAPQRRTGASRGSGPRRRLVCARVFCASLADVFDNKAPIGRVMISSF